MATMVWLKSGQWNSDKWQRLWLKTLTGHKLLSPSWKWDSQHAHPPAHTFLPCYVKNTLLLYFEHNASCSVLFLYSFLFSPVCSGSWLQPPDQCMTCGLMTHGASTKIQTPTMEFGIRFGEDSTAMQSKGQKSVYHSDRAFGQVWSSQESRVTVLNEYQFMCVKLHMHVHTHYLYTQTLAFSCVSRAVAQWISKDLVMLNFVFSIMKKVALISDCMNNNVFCIGTQLLCSETFLYYRVYWMGHIRTMLMVF